MRKIISLLGLLLLCESNMQADNYVVGNVTVPQGGTTTLEIGLDNSTTECGGFQFVLSTASGITASTAVKGSRVGEEFTLSSSTTAEGFNVLAYNTSASVISGTSGAIVSITLSADAGLAVGTVLNGQLNTAYISNRDGDSFDMDNVDFTITIGEPADTRTLLDENSTTPPTASGGAVDIRVRRTINANSWSTICLPFAMTEAQTKEVFGNDVQLADFTGYETTEDADENIVGITVNFSNVTALEANHPYIIKVSSPVTEFTLDNVEIAPEEEPTNAVIKRTKKQWSEMIGTYVAETEIEAQMLFISGGNFWYSAGSTKMKGYRAYFDFYDVLTEVENAGVKMFVNIDGEEETGIENVNVNDNPNGTIFDLSGRKLDKTPQKGVYIVNGKKILH